MDVVYVLGKGSLVNDLEILYSVRSIEKYMLDLNKIYVVGEKPEKLPGLIHINEKDDFARGWKNVHFKTKKACEEESISEVFLFMNDDFFMLDYFRGAHWPFYALKGSNGGPDGPTAFHVHCPIRYKKDWYKQMPIDLNSKGQHSLRTFYANFFKAPPTMTDDFVLNMLSDYEDCDFQIAEWPCFSVSNSAMLNEKFRAWLDKLYPEPSRFEK